MYDTLIEWDYETLKPKPGLAESWSFPIRPPSCSTSASGVTFHDGTPLDAEAVKFNLDRNKSDPALQHQGRSGDASTSVEVTGPMQVTLKLNAPDAALPASCRDRAGHDGVADGAQGERRRQRHAHAGRRRRLYVRQLGGQREASSSSATRNTGEGEPALSRRHRVRDHSRD